ncbi:MAG: fibrinogen-like YCDxxxxGGGW domain-containing protein [Polyangiales bacterium]
MRSSLLLIAFSSRWLTGCAYPEFDFRSADVSIDDTGELEVALDTALESDGFEAAVDSADVSIDDADTGDASVGVPGSCAEIHVTDPKAPSGTYLVDPDREGPRTSFKVFCDMSSDGGGWALVAKLDGTKATWVYDSARWTDDSTFDSLSTDLTFAEAKFRSFNEMPLSQIRVRMHDGSTARAFFTNLVGTSLKDLFKGGAIATTAGRTQWLSLVPDPSLQANCNSEGLNQEWTSGGGALIHLRLGIVGNNEMDCDSPDSFIGFGAAIGAPGVCYGGVDPAVTVGNAARVSCMAPKDKTTKLFGFLFIR